MPPPFRNSAGAERKEGGGTKEAAAGVTGAGGCAPGAETAGGEAADNEAAAAFCLRAQTATGMAEAA